MLTFVIGEPPAQVDASLSTQWLEVEGVYSYHMLRAIGVLGVGLGNTRFRMTDRRVPQPFPRRTATSSRVQAGDSASRP